MIEELAFSVLVNGQLLRTRLLRRVLFGVPDTSVSVRGRQLELHHHPSIASPPTSLAISIMRLLAKSIGRPRITAPYPAIATASGRRHLTNNGFFRVSEEVREALHSKKPVVALETTIYTHGGNMYMINTRCRS